MSNKILTNIVAPYIVNRIDQFRVGRFSNHNTIEKSRSPISINFIESSFHGCFTNYTTLYYYFFSSHFTLRVKYTITKDWTPKKKHCQIPNKSHILIQPNVTNSCFSFGRMDNVNGSPKPPYGLCISRYHWMLCTHWWIELTMPLII